MQRRVKIWHREKVRDLIFGPYGSGFMNPQSASTAAADNRLVAAKSCTVAATGWLCHSSRASSWGTFT